MTNTFSLDNADYETWLRGQCDVVESDLDHKHHKMTKDPFVFLRATYFRWARRIEATCPELKDAPAVLSVGDTHLENFGTWRDAEGRLVWGVNDFDEAAVIPYPFDLVRLAASIRLARGMSIDQGDAAMAILDGYRRGLATPRPTLLDDQETWMRPLVACSDDDRDHFWKAIDELPTIMPPADVMDSLVRSLPAGVSRVCFASRTKGGGSLGRPRYVAIAHWRGGRIVREAKALVPSAWDWAHDSISHATRFLDLATAPFRSPDPHLQLASHNSIILRRIAADSRKVELGDHGGQKMKIELLAAMGFDLGAIHAAQAGADAAIEADLARREPEWLRRAARIAAATVVQDYDAWMASFHAAAAPDDPDQ